jgi:ABC-type sugar transport system permease subunit
MTFLALVLAVLLNSKRVRAYRFFRLVIFLPFITNMVAAGFAFNLLFSQQIGLFNVVLTSLGLPPVSWLESVWGARVSLSIMLIWHWLGYNMVIMLAGLQTIPHDLTEAAKIDGASSIRAFFGITIPLMQPVILFTIILSTIGSFDLFTELVSLFTSTGGSGPLNATVTPTLRVFNATFVNLRFGYASAMAYAFFALVFVVALLQLRYFGREIDS